MKPLLALTFLVSFAASAANLDCSIKASKTTKKADMPGMAKVSVDDAKKTALGAVNASGAAITKEERDRGSDRRCRQRKGPQNRA